MDPVVHFEMPVKDGKRASNFYSKIFGWKMQDMGSQMGHYILAHTSETDAKGMIKKPGAINGGFFPWKDNKMSSSSHVVIAVDDIKKSMKNVGRHGGKVIGQPMNIPEVGKYVMFFDTEGNKDCLLQPVMRK